LKDPSVSPGSAETDVGRGGNLSSQFDGQWHQEYLCQELLKFDYLVYVAISNVEDLF